MNTLHIANAPTPLEELRKMTSSFEATNHPLGQASFDYLERIRGHVSRLPKETGLRDRADFARSWHILMKGSIMARESSHPSTLTGRLPSPLIYIAPRPGTHSAETRPIIGFLSNGISTESYTADGG